MTNQEKLYYEDLLYNNGIQFEPKEHVYTMNGEEFTSATTFVGSFFEEFDEDRISKIVANRDGITQEEVLQLWQDIREYGTLVHEEIETADDVEDMETFEAKQGRQFLDALELTSDVKYMFPEALLRHPKYKVSGTSDMVVIHENGDVSLIDWKTSKKITRTAYKNKTGTKQSTQNYSDHKYNKYKLQLSVYAYILEHMLEGDVNIRNLYLVHLTPKGYDYYEMDYEKDLVQSMMEEYSNERRR